MRTGAHNSFATADTIVVAVAPLELGGGCQLSRVVAVGLAGYLGFLIGQLAQFPLAVNSDAKESVAIDLAGAIAGVVLIVDAPLSRPLPFCPAAMRTLANTPTNHLGACRASRVLNGGLGAAAGMVAAGALAIPFVLGNSGKHIVNVMFIALPVSGAAVGALRAANSPPCQT